MVEYKQITTTTYSLTEEGEGITQNGSHEYRVWEVLPVKGQGEPVGIPELKVSNPFSREALSGWQHAI